MSDSEFYRRDRPENAELPEDRPRGGGPEDLSRRHRSPWIWITIVVIIVLAVAIVVPLI
ncbi:hypothetical protein [Streptomyces sp. ML-6]|uniref:hypothetical protein n=1 Tax=unclassified Streptomyces TaxID=2593676 RepID=UPI0024C0E369|nr:hypothetical protein [Streptomyces sp. ML-6]MDK0523679.1 hypothetical protein [Streptomyces sp. ML-6]